MIEPNPVMSAPAPGRTMVAALRPLHERVRHSLSLLRLSLQQVSSDELKTRYQRTYGERAETEDCYGASILGAWLVARAHGGPIDSLTAAEGWLLGDATGPFGELVPRGDQNRIVTALSVLPAGTTLDELLPYLLEAIER